MHEVFESFGVGDFEKWVDAPVEFLVYPDERDEFKDKYRIKIDVNKFNKDGDTPLFSVDVDVKVREAGPGRSWADVARENRTYSNVTRFYSDGSDGPRDLEYFQQLVFDAVAEYVAG